MLGFAGSMAPAPPPPAFLMLRLRKRMQLSFSRPLCRCRNTATTLVVCYVGASTSSNGRHSCNLAAIALFTAAVMVFSTAEAATATRPPPPQHTEEEETLSNIPQTLSGECASPSDCKKGRIQRPKSKKAESCTLKCVTTCIRGGAGSPGEGPLNATRPLVVFKQGFRSRQYCLVECSDICNLIKDGEDDGP